MGRTCATDAVEHLSDFILDALNDWQPVQHVGVMCPHNTTGHQSEAAQLHIHVIPTAHDGSRVLRLRTGQRCRGDALSFDNRAEKQHRTRES